MNKVLIVSTEIYEKIPNLVVLTGTVEVREPDKTSIEKYLNKAWERLTTEVKKHGYKTHPRIASLREALIKARIPVGKFPPSIEAIAKRTLSSSQPFSINPIVDVYNAISMDLVVPFGAYDLSLVDGGLQLRLARKGEPFYAIGSAENEPTYDGEIVYSDNKTILTRQFLWRQSEKAKIAKETRNIVFVCELLTDVGEEFIEQTKRTIYEKFAKLLNGSISNFSINEGKSAAS